MKFKTSSVRTLAWLVVATALTACASKMDNNSKEPRHRYFFDAFLGQDSYSKVFDDHTLEKRVHSEFEPVMTAFATIWNSSMREAYIREMARQFRYDDAQEAALAKEQLAENEAYIVFVISASTREPSWNDFEKQHSMWRITLESPDGKLRLDPERVEAISEKDETAKYFYQHMNSFGRTYKIRFPRDAFRQMDRVSLHITGTRGYVIFDFKLPQPQAPHLDNPTEKSSTSEPAE